MSICLRMREFNSYMISYYIGSSNYTLLFWIMNPAWCLLQSSKQISINRVDWVSNNKLSSVSPPVRMFSISSVKFFTGLKISAVWNFLRKLYVFFLPKKMVSLYICELFNLHRCRSNKIYLFHHKKDSRKIYH